MTVTTRGKGDFADVIKLWTLKWGDNLDYLLGLSIIMKVLPCKRGSWANGIQGSGGQSRAIAGWKRAASRNWKGRETRSP